MDLCLVVLTALFAPTFASWSNTEVETITACTTQYGPAKNTTDYGLEYVSTDTYTTSAWTYFSKTEVLTLRPSTTTLSATSTSTSYLYPADNWTTTVYTSTYYDSYVATQTEAVPFTTTVIVSQVETLTVPTLEGFIPVGSASPGAAKKTNSWDIPDGWDVQDVYWTTEPSTTNIATGYPIYTDLLWRRDEQSSQPLKVDCTVTIQSNSFYTTSYIKVSGPRATLTRTEIVATETSTFTVRTKPTAPPPTSVYTIEDTYWTTNISYATETVATVQTVSTRLHHSQYSSLSHLLIPRRQQKQSTPRQRQFWPLATPPTSSTRTTATGCATLHPGSQTVGTTPNNKFSLGTRTPSTRRTLAARAPSWTPRRSFGGTLAIGVRAVRSGRATLQVVLLQLVSMGRVEARSMCGCTMNRLLIRGFGPVGMWAMGLVVTLGLCLCGSKFSSL